MKYLLTVFCVLMLFASCNNDDTEDNIEPRIYPKAQRTVIVYISGENNLSSAAANNIKDMVTGSASIPNNTNLVAFVDVADKSDPPYIIRIKDGAKTVDPYYNNTEDFYSSDPNRMYETINWIMTRYPADSYGLVLWGHADGWIIEKDSVATTSTNKVMHRAYGIDTGDNTTNSYGKWMNIPSMATALERLPNKFKFIFADCCCFQCAEVAYELRNTTEYIIGSPAEIPGYGADYDKVVPAMFDESDDFYRSIVDNYIADNSRYDVPLSVIKTSEMENLAQATAAAMRNIYSNGEPEFGSLVYYLYQNYGRVMFDINDFMLLNSTDYSEWKVALDKAVVYKKMATRWMTNGYVSFGDFTMTEEKYGGMSMFVPRPIYDTYGQDWNWTISQMQWFYAVGMGNY